MLMVRSASLTVYVFWSAVPCARSLALYFGRSERMTEMICCPFSTAMGVRSQPLRDAGQKRSRRHDHSRSTASKIEVRFDVGPSTMSGIVSSETHPTLMTYDGRLD